MRHVLVHATAPDDAAPVDDVRHVCTLLRCRLYECLRNREGGAGCRDGEVGAARMAGAKGGGGVAGGIASGDDVRHACTLLRCHLCRFWGCKRRGVECMGHEIPPLPPLLASYHPIPLPVYIHPPVLWWAGNLQ